MQSCEADSDEDVYHNKVFDKLKKIEAKEALDTMENRIRNNFSRFKVKKKDQDYKLCEIIHVEAEEEGCRRVWGENESEKWWNTWTCYAKH